MALIFTKWVWTIEQPYKVVTWDNLNYLGTLTKLVGL